MRARPRTASTHNPTPTPAIAPTPENPRFEDADLREMWNFYREHKVQLLPDIKEYREGIVREVKPGKPVAEAFAPYFRPMGSWFR